VHALKEIRAPALLSFSLSLFSLCLSISSHDSPTMMFCLTTGAEERILVAHCKAEET
jgi:hypothetical protein